MDLEEVGRLAFVVPRLKRQNKNATKIEYCPNKSEGFQTLRKEAKSCSVFVKFFTNQYKKILNWHIENKRISKEIEEYYSQNRRRKEAILKCLTDAPNVTSDNIFHEQLISSLRKEIDEMTPYSEKIIKKLLFFTKI